MSKATANKTGMLSHMPSQPNDQPHTLESELARRLDVAVVLVAPKTAGNVGAAARAMLNMGAAQLRIVAPRCDYLSSEARALAVHAEDLLEKAQVFTDLRSALADRDLSIGSSARQRGDLPPPQHPSILRPLIQQAEAVALVFGPEETGLVNSDLEQCQATVCLPTAGYASLNLAQAVLLVCYEFLQPQTEPIHTEFTQPMTPQIALQQQINDNHFKLASREEMEGMYQHLLETMQLIGYTDAVRSQHILRLWRKMLDRAAMSSAESRMFRGLLRQTRWKINNVNVQHPMHLRRAQERAQKAKAKAAKCQQPKNNQKHASNEKE